ncbi:small ribosomal subunit protein eS27-like [Oryctolagus cuniculus]|uniref:small ribosomal subunit protein eS27-like n=1 Tax=Oryctolagus cuniculus TaxID=9986 RepID=UPI0007EE316C|nr:40S ribosomal protein S27 [Oryctolagus cuniculus]
MPLAEALLHPSPEEEKRKHKKHLVRSPSSYSMGVEYPGCYEVTLVFSHAHTVALCVGCCTVFSQCPGGKARVREGCSFRRKQCGKHPEARGVGNLPSKCMVAINFFLKKKTKFVTLTKFISQLPFKVIHLSLMRF